MESAQKLELIDQAIKKLLAEKNNNEASVRSFEEDNDQVLLKRLLSELEELKESSSAIKESEDEVDCGSAGEVVGFQNEKDRGEIDAEEIVKELKYVKRQNVVTQCLVSALIVITLAWQLSEVSLILKLKEGFSHPFRSFGGILAGMIKPPGKNGKDAEKDEPNEGSSLHIPDLGFHGEEN